MIDAKAMTMGAPSPTPGALRFILKEVTSAQPCSVMLRARSSGSLPRGSQVKNTRERGKGKPRGESHITNPAARKGKRPYSAFPAQEPAPGYRGS